MVVKLVTLADDKNEYSFQLINDWTKQLEKWMIIYGKKPKLDTLSFSLKFYDNKLDIIATAEEGE